MFFPEGRSSPFALTGPTPSSIVRPLWSTLESLRQSLSLGRYFCILKDS
jgi:hypothetical protein